MSFVSQLFLVSFQVELIHPALKGTLNVLGSCAKNSSIRRVVLTSSIAAVAINSRPRTPEVVVDESWFADPELSKQNKVCTHAIHSLSFCFINSLCIWKLNLRLVKT